MKEEYHKWRSQYIDREFEMLVFGYTGFPVIVFPTSRGRYFQAKDSGLINSVNDLIYNGKIKVYCPDSIDHLSWYNYEIHPADRVKTHNAYENLVLNDVIEFARYETGYKRVCLSGCSFGGYHASNIAFRHPDRAAYLFTMGGAFDIKQFIMGYFDDNCYFNNPPDYLANLSDDWYLDRMRKMGIIFGTGELDMCVQDNIRVSEILNKLSVPHWLDNRKNTGHDWKWWKEMFPYYLSKIEV